MGRFIGVVLSFSFLLSGADGIELFKLPGLLKHYAEHREEQPELGVLDYLTIHYNSLHADESGHDHNLPFKSHEHSTACMQILACIGGSPSSGFLIDAPVIGAVYPSCPFKLRHVGGNGVWQPPRLG
jgi:hypothetical protein